MAHLFGVSTRVKKNMNMSHRGIVHIPRRNLGYKYQRIIVPKALFTLQTIFNHVRFTIP